MNSRCPDRAEPNSRKVTILKAVIELCRGGGQVSSSDIKDYLDQEGVSMEPAALRTCLVRYSRQGLLRREKKEGANGYLYSPNDRTEAVVKYFEEEHEDYDKIVSLQKENNRLRQQKDLYLIMNLLSLRNKRRDELAELLSETGLAKDLNIPPEMAAELLLYADWSQLSKPNSNGNQTVGLVGFICKTCYTCGIKRLLSDGTKFYRDRHICDKLRVKCFGEAERSYFFEELEKRVVELLVNDLKKCTLRPNCLALIAVKQKAVEDMGDDSIDLGRVDKGSWAARATTQDFTLLSDREVQDFVKKAKATMSKFKITFGERTGVYRVAIWNQFGYDLLGEELGKYEVSPSPLGRIVGEFLSSDSIFLKRALEGVN